MPLTRRWRRTIGAALAAVVVAAGAWWWADAARTVSPGPYRIGYVHDPPYMFTGPDGVPRGLSVEVAREAARRAGLRLEWLRVDPASNADTALLDGTVDLWPALTVLPHREKTFFFTDPWLRTDVYMVVRGDGPAPDDDYTGTIGLPPLPVIEHLLATYAPRAPKVYMKDGPALARALCRGELSAALLPAGDFAYATMVPEWGCQAQGLRPHNMPNSTLNIAVASRPQFRDAALALRTQIDAMASDGSIQTIVLPYSFYAASEIFAVYENLQNRDRARLYRYGIAGLALALAGTIALSVALIRAQRSARRSVEARAALEAKMRTSQHLEAVGQLAGGVAHDFNNLITVIVGNCELAQVQAGDVPAIEEPLSEIRKASDRAAGLVRQLLAFSRRQVTTPTVLGLNDELQQTLPMLRRVLREHVVIELDLQARHDRVLMDRGQLSQIVLNLTVNARDAMPEGGMLRVATQNRRSSTGGPASICLSVSDTGIGMTPEVQSRAFEPFFSTKAPGQGTGLGLATVYGIVTQAGGSIDLRSRFGEGTTVEITLPVAQGEIEPARPVEPAAGQERTKAVILVVEDQADVRKLVVQALTAAGHTVLEADNGASGLECLEAHHESVDLVVSDVVMPALSGVAMMQAAAAVGIRVPALFMSGYAEDETAAREVAGRLLRKPFTRDALLEAAETALRERERARA
jgi:signal transduction histidine kinase/CheY-like chemotaxis protein